MLVVLFVLHGLLKQILILTLLLMQESIDMFVKKLEDVDLQIQMIVEVLPQMDFFAPLQLLFHFG